MKVATRITVATAVVVAIASAAYAYFDLLARTTERQAGIEREARVLAHTIRAVLEKAVAEGAREASLRADQLQAELDAIDAELAVPADAPAPPTGTKLSPEKRAALERERGLLNQRLVVAKTTAGLTRTIDQTLAYRPPPDSQLRELSPGSMGWRVAVFPRSRRNELVGPEFTETQRRRLQTLLDLPELTLASIEDHSYYFAVPLRVASGPPNERALGMLELSKSAESIETTAADLGRAAVLVLLIVGITTIVVGAVASRFVSRPITKLLRGIDDVAKGDLSHVILSEHDDEIGAIATRFNEMTFSLRESRAETLRQNEAKLALEQRLGQTEKLATIGQLAAEIAHEVGTPLNVIAGRARSIQKKAKDPESVEKNAGIVAEQTARITRIIQRLLDFTRRKVGAPEQAEVNLNNLAITTIELLAGQFAVAKVKTRLDRADNLPRVAGDTDRLQQVLINLLLNAVQAMPEGGSLVVETRAVQRARPGLEGGAEQQFVTLSVTDTGIGIPADIKDKIFDPFYTTKDGEGGTGLGLAVVTGIVKEHDGWIDVDDAAGGGTVFRVFLPA